ADESGVKRGEFNYSDFGETAVSGNVGDIRYRYTGQEWDEEAGEYNYLAREYDPATGRFNSLDPAREGISPYEYARSNPINYVDPDGKAPKIIKWKYTVTLDSILSSPPIGKSQGLKLIQRPAKGYGGAFQRLWVQKGRVGGISHRTRVTLDELEGKYHFAMSSELITYVKEVLVGDQSHYTIIEEMNGRNPELNIGETSLLGIMKIRDGMIKKIKIKSYSHEINDPELMKLRVEKMLGALYGGEDVPMKLREREIKVHINVNGEVGELPSYEVATKGLPSYQEATRFAPGEYLGEGARVRLPRIE
ncbi:RHS repeat-associated core domain-containing protein, partial [Propionigenium maris]|uniref:RHS repeat-associated core domain-containing protein n=1 Tax=Propionigenium maris TaxID=45622 RepID=UPI002491B42E